MPYDRRSAIMAAAWTAARQAELALFVAVDALQELDDDLRREAQAILDDVSGLYYAMDCMIGQYQDSARDGEEAVRWTCSR